MSGRANVMPITLEEHKILMESRFAAMAEELMATADSYVTDMNKTLSSAAHVEWYISDAGVRNEVARRFAAAGWSVSSGSADTNLRIEYPSF